MAVRMRARKYKVIEYDWGRKCAEVATGYSLPIKHASCLVMLARWSGTVVVVSFIILLHLVTHCALTHRQLLPQIRFLKSFLNTNYSFRVLVLRPGFTGTVLRQKSPGALGFWVSSLFVEIYTSCC